jgi:hypothetical protein
MDTAKRQEVTKEIAKCDAELNALERKKTVR